VFEPTEIRVNLPEPATALLLMGAGLLAVRRRR